MLLPAKLERLERQRRIRRSALDDPNGTIDSDVSKSLRDTGRRPVDVERFDPRGLAETDVLAQRARAEAAPAPDVTIDRPWFAVFENLHADSRANRGPVRLDAHGLDGNPVVPETGVLVQDAVIPVARLGAAHLLEDVLVAVVVEIGKRDA